MNPRFRSYIYFTPHNSFHSHLSASRHARNIRILTWQHIRQHRSARILGRKRIRAGSRCLCQDSGWRKLQPGLEPSAGNSCWLDILPLYGGEIHKTERSEIHTALHWHTKYLRGGRGKTLKMDHVPGESRRPCASYALTVQRGFARHPTEKLEKCNESPREPF